jgi:hypothetical protein
MKGKIKTILADQFTRISLIFSIVILLPLITIIVLTYNNLPPLIPFFNSMPWGEDRLFSSSYIIFMPISIFLVFVLNTFLATFSYAKYVLVARIIMINTFLFLILGLLAYLQIIFLTF